MRSGNRLAEGLVVMALLAATGLMVGGERMGRSLGIDEVPRGVALVQRVGSVRLYAAASKFEALGIISWMDGTDVIAVGINTRQGWWSERRPLNSEIPLMKP